MCVFFFFVCVFFFLQAEDGIRDLVRSRGLGDVYKRQKVRGKSRMPALSEKKALMNSGVSVEGAMRNHAASSR